MRITRAKHLLVAAVLALLPRMAAAQPRPLGNVSLQQIIGIVVRNLLGLMGTAALAVFVWAGFLWMTAGGDEKKVEKSKSIILYASLGIVIAFSAYSIVAFLLTSIERAQG